MDVFTKADAIGIANKLDVSFDLFPLEDFLTGLNIELEHGRVNLDTNVTDDDLEKTAKIALAHLHEYPDYYNPIYGLPAFERMLKAQKKYRSHYF